MLNFLKNKNSFKKSFLKIRDINPNICWQFILCLSFVLIILSFVFNLSFLRKIDKEIIFSDKNIEKKYNLDKERTEKVLEYFSVREWKTNDILNNKIKIIDPSL